MRLFENGHVFVCENCRKPDFIKGYLINLKVCANCHTMHFSDQIETVYPYKSAVPEDMTILCIGTLGVYDHKKFEIIGRRRLHLQEGYYRNDWYLLFDDKAEVWMYQSYYSYPIVEGVQHEMNYDLLKDLAIYENLKLEEKNFTTELIVKYEDETYEGELPKVKAFDEQSRLIELGDTRENVAYISMFSKNDIYYELGKRILIEDLQLTNVRIADGWT